MIECHSKTSAKITGFWNSNGKEWLTVIDVFSNSLMIIISKTYFMFYFKLENLVILRKEVKCWSGKGCKCQWAAWYLFCFSIWNSVKMLQKLFCFVTCFDYRRFNQYLSSTCVTKLSTVMAGPVLVSWGWLGSFSRCLTLSAWNMTAVLLFNENLGVGRTLFLYRSDYVRYLYSVAIGMLILKEWTLFSAFVNMRDAKKRFWPNAQLWQRHSYLQIVQLCRKNLLRAGENIYVEKRSSSNPVF